MARTYPLSLGYTQCLGVKEEPLSFSSVCLEDLRNGDLEYLSTIEQLVDAFPKTEDPASRLALPGHVTPTGHQRLRHSVGHRTPSITISHARDGVWSCEGVMSPDLFMRVA